MRAISFATAGLATLVLGAGCDLDALQLVQNYDVAAGELLPADVVDLDRVDDPPALDGGAFRGDVGPSDIGAGNVAGATVTIEGTGDRVCVIVDPQSVFRDDTWIDATGSQQPNPFMRDYPHDDGDIDLLAGLAAYYTGTPGSEMGDFINFFPDENGVERRVDLNICLQQDQFGANGGSAGRATPEFCSFPTEVGVDYRIALVVYSVPLDDNLLGYMLDIRTGECPQAIDECTLRGDADPAPEGVLPEGFSDVEEMFCGPEDSD